MDAKQQKTFIGIILVVILGSVACCGLTVAVGALFGYQEAQKLAKGGGPDAGSRVTRKPTQPAADDDETQNAGDNAQREEFAEEILAGLADAGHPEYVYQAESYDLVTDGGAMISLDNLYEEYADKQDTLARREFVERTVRGFFPAEVPTDWDEAAPNLVATVRDRIFVELLAIRSDKPLDVLQRPLSDDLVELVVYDGADSMQYVNDGHLADWGKNADEVFLQGRKTLAARSRDAFNSPAPGVYESPWEDNHDIGRALLFETLRKLKVKGEPVIFLPQRDHLLVTGSNDRAGLEAVADLVSERLSLPRSNTGRGWRLTKQGLVPFIPGPNDEVLGVLRAEALASNANEQKKALDEKFEKEGTDIFVGTTLFTDDDDGKQTSYCVWTKGAVTLMPKADFVVFVDLDEPEPDRVVAAGLWDDVMKKVGGKVSLEQGYWPVRYKVTTFPDARTIKAIGLHHYFTRNKENDE